MLRGLGQIGLAVALEPGQSGFPWQRGHQEEPVLVPVPASLSLPTGHWRSKLRCFPRNQKALRARWGGCWRVRSGWRRSPWFAPSVSLPSPGFLQCLCALSRAGFLVRLWEGSPWIVPRVSSAGLSAISLATVSFSAVRLEEIPVPVFELFKSTIY